jgi:outer membrane protein assembly factor BamB
VAGAGAENGGAPALAGAGGTVTAGAAGTGTAGTVGSAGAAGAVATAGAGGAPAAGNGSVTQRGADSARTSHWVQPTLTRANMAKMAPDTNFKANFAGEFTSSPLFLAGATPGTGRFYAATTENDVYALDETSGATVWKRNIGGYLANAPVCLATPIHHGILSTGVIDPDTRVLYVAAAMADGHHEVHALSLDNMGAEVAGWPLDVSTVSAGTLAFKPIQGVQNQRSALSLVGGIIYVAFGGYCGDAGAYHGWVVAVDSKDPKKVGAWATSDARQAGIWAAGGLASDGNGVFAITGNVAGLTGANHAGSDSEEILRLTGLAVPHRDNANLFLPAEWANPMNASDKDFGSCSPALITVPNSTPSKVIVAPAKPGHVYFLDATNLGGERGQFAEAVVATTTDQSLYTAPSAYQAPTGVYVAMTTGIGSQCPNGGGGNGNVMSILMQPGVTPDKPPMPKIAWCAPVNSTDNATHYISPISTNSAGSADPIVWMINAGKLNAFDGEKGTMLYDSGASTCVGVQKFTAPIAVNGRIVTGGSSSGQAHLCSWSVH